MVWEIVKPGFIYQAENQDNGKKYIGMTTRSLEVRKKEHLKDALIKKAQKPP